MQLAQFKILLAKYGSTPTVKFYASAAEFLKSLPLPHLFFALDFMDGDGLTIMAALEDLAPIIVALPANSIIPIAYSNQQRRVGMEVKQKTSAPGSAQTPTFKMILEKVYAEGDSPHSHMSFRRQRQNRS